MTQGISQMAISAMPTIGAVIGDTIAPGIGGAVGSAVGTAAQSSIAGSDLGLTSTSSEGMLGAPELPSVDRTILSFQGESAPQMASASVVPTIQQTEDIESLKHFFKRPVRLDTAPLTIKHAWLWPSEYFSAPAVSDKLKSYSGARYTLCFRITSNAMPFSNGAYLISYMPNDMYTEDPDEIVNGSTASTKLVYTLVAGFHTAHVVHDISQTSSTELRIPFWQPVRFLDTGTLLGANSSEFSSNNMLGRLDILNINEAYKTGYQSVDGNFEVWCWLEDLELFYPTDFSTIHARSSDPPRVPTRFQFNDDDRAFQTQGPEHHSHGAGSTVVARRDRVDDVAHPPGIAKPMSLTSTLTEPVGNFSDSILDYFKIYSLLGFLPFGNETGEYTATHVHVRPYTECNLSKNLVGIAPTFAAPPPTKLAVSTDMFQFWKGSIKFRINFIASKFHSGRIQFGFVPHVALSTAYPTDENLWANINTVVLDLREQHSVEIVCPYRLSLNHAYRTDVSGTLISRVISPLQAPAEAAPRIVAYVEIAAGDDFSVSRYNPNNTAINWFGEQKPARARFATIGESEGNLTFDPTDDLDFETQSGGIGMSKLEEVRDVINDGPVTFSQIFAAPCPYDTPVTQGSQTLYVGADNDVLVNPWTVIRPLMSASTPMAMSDEASPLYKARSLFYGYHGDMYMLEGFGTVRYGLENSNIVKDVTFPYFGNVQYSAFGTLGQSGTGGNTALGPGIRVKGSVPNIHLFYPWTCPLMNGVDAPRITRGRSFISNITHMKGQNRG
jgi:hypothetical protein